MPACLNFNSSLRTEEQKDRHSTMLVVYKKRLIAAGTLQNRDFSGGPAARRPGGPAARPQNGAHFGHTRFCGEKKRPKGPVSAGFRSQKGGRRGRRSALVLAREGIVGDVNF